MLNSKPEVRKPKKRNNEEMMSINMISKIIFPIILTQVQEPTRQKPKNLPKLAEDIGEISIEQFILNRNRYKLFPDNTLTWDEQRARFGQAIRAYKQLDLNADVSDYYQMEIATGFMEHMRERLRQSNGKTLEQLQGEIADLLVFFTPNGQKDEITLDSPGIKKLQYALASSRESAKTEHLNGYGIQREKHIIERFQNYFIANRLIHLVCPTTSIRLPIYNTESIQSLSNRLPNGQIIFYPAQKIESYISSEIARLSQISSMGAKQNLQLARLWAWRLDYALADPSFYSKEECIGKGEFYFFQALKHYFNDGDLKGFIDTSFEYLHFCQRSGMYSKFPKIIGDILLWGEADQVAQVKDLLANWQKIFEENKQPLPSSHPKANTFAPFAMKICESLIAFENDENAGQTLLSIELEKVNEFVEFFQKGELTLIEMVELVARTLMQTKKTLEELIPIYDASILTDALAQLDQKVEKVLIERQDEFAIPLEFLLLEYHLNLSVREEIIGYNPLERLQNVFSKIDFSNVVKNTYFLDHRIQGFLFEWVQSISHFSESPPEIKEFLTNQFQEFLNQAKVGLQDQNKEQELAVVYWFEYQVTNSSESKNKALEYFIKTKEKAQEQEISDSERDLINSSLLVFRNLAQLELEEGQKE